MQVRQERPADASGIRDVTVAAFKNMPHGDRTEAKIIEALRAAGSLTLSLVAIEDGKVVGHVAFSPVRIGGVRGDWYGLGPVSVRPERQRGGIGQALIRRGIGTLKSMGADGCVVLGDPAYYGRFGFANDPDLYYRGFPSEYLQHLAFEGYAPKGEVHYHPGFDSS